MRRMAGIRLRLAKEAKEKRKERGEQTEEEKGLASEEGRVEGGYAGGFQVRIS